MGCWGTLSSSLLFALSFTSLYCPLLTLLLPRSVCDFTSHGVHSTFLCLKLVHWSWLLSPASCIQPLAWTWLPSQWLFLLLCASCLKSWASLIRPPSWGLRLVGRPPSGEPASAWWDDLRPPWPCPLPWPWDSECYAHWGSVLQPGKSKCCKILETFFCVSSPNWLSDSFEHVCRADV